MPTVRDIVAAELAQILRGFDPKLHPRYPKGHPLGGKFIPKGSADFKKAIEAAKNGQAVPQAVAAVKDAKGTAKGAAKAPRAAKKAAAAKGTFRELSPDGAQAMQDAMHTKGGAWTKAQETAIRDYTSAGYVKMNGALHRPGHPPKPTKKTVRQIQDLHGAMRPTPEPVRAYRGVNGRALGLSKDTPLADLVGKSFQNAGFSSTTVDRTAVGRVDQGDYEAVLVLDVPAGTPAAYVQSLSAYAEDGEYELLLDAGMKFEFTKVEMGDGKLPLIHATVVPA